MEKTPKKSSKKTPDPFKKLKYIGYCRACAPPGKGMQFKDFVNYVKTYLCFETKTLFKDPIWDSYSDEDLIVEYFARIFRVDKDRRQKFEAEIGKKDTDYDNFLEFADAQIEKNQEELNEKADELEDNVSYSPEVLGD